MAKLTDKMEQFCNEYIIDFNATQAAIRAKYSEKTAYSIGNENLKKPEIKERIAELINEHIDGTRSELKKKVLDELEKLALHTDAEDLRGNEKIKSLELLGKWGGLFDERIALEVTENLPDMSKYTKEELKQLAKLRRKTIK